MNALSELLANFDLSIMFDAIGKLAKIVAGALSPLLLILSINIRLMETQLDALIGNGKFGRALRDIMLWTLVLGTYFGIMSLINGFFNEIYKWLEGFGSIKSIMTVYQEALNRSVSDISVKEVVMGGVPSAVYATIASAAYFISLLGVAALTLFLNIANVLVFGMAFIWGLIAIPVSISMTFKILGGWARMLGFALVWPIVQGLMLALFGLLIQTAIAGISGAEKSAVYQSSDLMMMYTVMNLILIAVLIAAPMIANALVSNTSAAAGVVLPFVGAATAAVAALGKGAGDGAMAGGSKLMQLATPPKPEGNSPQPRAVARPSASGSGPVPRGQAGNQAAAAVAAAPGQAASAAPSPAAAPGGSGPGARDAGEKLREQRQQRRGVMIDRMRKAGGNKP